MKKIKMIMDKYEYKLIVNAIFEFRNQEIKNGKSVDYLDEVLEKWFKKVNQ